MRDPTREDILAVLNRYFQLEGRDDFDVEEAIYWFAADWHSGQGSNLYSMLSTSPYKPRAIERGCEAGSDAQLMYETLEAEYVNPNEARA